ncbi:hypothetical protein [Sphingobacterium sp. LRF_L2]|uniref:hypothetical protein n=1 Tax=Sphingobacterium sp. LRF_L2 TaxID=3369421 RepID=UPI003F5EBD12
MEDVAQSEFEDFLMRMQNVLEYAGQLGMILQFIKEIGEKYGAREAHFRHERAADALPPRYYIQPGKPNKFGLRLYCIRLSEKVVILLNGDLKTKNNPEECPNCRKHFHFANSLVRKLDEAIKNREVILVDKELHMDDDFEIEL